MALKNTLLESAATVAHEANRAYCKSIGDNSQPRWKDCTEEHKDSVRQGVLFHCNHPEAQPADSHNNWYARKQAEGWSYGPVKDPDNKRHPCFVPFDELPHDQQVKNILFKATVHGYLEARGHYIDGEISIGPCE